MKFILGSLVAGVFLFLGFQQTDVKLDQKFPSRITDKEHIKKLERSEPVQLAHFAIGVFTGALGATVRLQQQQQARGKAMTAFVLNNLEPVNELEFDPISK